MTTAVSPAWAGPIKQGDEPVAVYVTGEAPMVGNAPVGRIKTLDQHGLTLQFKDGDEVWIPAHAITGLRATRYRG